MDKDKAKIQSENNALLHSAMDKSLKVEIAFIIEKCMINRLKDDGMISDYECVNAFSELKKISRKAS